MMDHVSELLGEMSRSNQMLSQLRTRARMRSHIVARSINDELIRALDGEVLRGMPNLNPPDDGTNEVFRALQVRGKYPDAPLQLDASRSLVITSRGRIVHARAYLDDRNLRRVEVDAEGGIAEMRAEDLIPLVERVQLALQTHLARIERTAANYRAVDRFADKLGEVLGVVF